MHKSECERKMFLACVCAADTHFHTAGGDGAVVADARDVAAHQRKAAAQEACPEPQPAKPDRGLQRVGGLLLRHLCRCI